MLEILKELWTSYQEAWLPGSSTNQWCDLGQTDMPLWASCFSRVIWVNRLLAHPHRISVKLKQENNCALQMTMQCKDARDYCCCTDLDPNRPELRVPCPGDK